MLLSFIPVLPFLSHTLPHHHSFRRQWRHICEGRERERQSRDDEDDVLFCRERDRKQGCNENVWRNEITHQEERKDEKYWKIWRSHDSHPENHFLLLLFAGYMQSCPPSPPLSTSATQLLHVRFSSLIFLPLLMRMRGVTAWDTFRAYFCLWYVFCLIRHMNQDTGKEKYPWGHVYVSVCPSASLFLSVWPTSQPPTVSFILCLSLPESTFLSFPPSTLFWYLPSLRYTLFSLSLLPCWTHWVSARVT